MKTIIYIIGIIGIFYGCHKDLPIVKAVTQDSRLIGTWSQDSSGDESGGVNGRDGGLFHDTIFCSYSSWNEWFYLTGDNESIISAQWQTTSQDSILLQNNNHYWYVLHGNNLSLYLPDRTQTVIYWYHKCL